MKIALDIHGICDTSPEFFKELSRLFVEAGHELHILTGRRVSDGAMEEIEELGIRHTHFFSIADYHAEVGTKMWEDKNGNPWLDDETWDRTKGDYCKRNEIDFCIDDTERYGDYFSTPFGFMKIFKNK
jgi:copper homeostasis protein CutC